VVVVGAGIVVVVDAGTGVTAGETLSAERAAATQRPIRARGPQRPFSGAGATAGFADPSPPATAGDRADEDTTATVAAAARPKFAGARCGSAST
jgi:hypothetical protein